MTYISIYDQDYTHFNIYIFIPVETSNIFILKASLLEVHHMNVLGSSLLEVHHMYTIIYLLYYVYFKPQKLTSNLLFKKFLK